MLTSSRIWLSIPLDSRNPPIAAKAARDRTSATAAVAVTHMVSPPPPASTLKPKTLRGFSLPFHPTTAPFIPTASRHGLTLCPGAPSHICVALLPLLPIVNKLAEQWVSSTLDSNNARPSSDNGRPLRRRPKVSETCRGLKEGCKLLELAFKIVEQQQRQSSMASMGFWFAQKLGVYTRNYCITNLLASCESGNWGNLSMV